MNEPTSGVALSVFTYAILLLSLIASASGQNRNVDLFAGCYEVTDLSWTPPDQYIKVIPKHLELLNIPVVYRNWFAMRNLEAEQNLVEKLSSWKPESQERVTVIWGTGFGGFRGTLRKAGDHTLSGKIKEWCDSRCNWTKRTGTIQLNRISCKGN